MANSTTSKALHLALAKILSTVFIVQCGSISIRKKERADLPLHMPLHRLLHPFAVAVALG